MKFNVKHFTIVTLPVRQSGKPVKWNKCKSIKKTAKRASQHKGCHVRFFNH